VCVAAAVATPPEGSNAASFSQLDLRWVCHPEFPEPSPRTHAMSFYNLRAVTLTSANLRSLNADFERRARIEDEAEKRPKTKKKMRLRTVKITRP
jgi:hypothetical protein